MAGRSRGKVNKTRRGQTTLGVFLFCLPHCVPCYRFLLALCLIRTSHPPDPRLKAGGKEAKNEGLGHLCSVL